MGHIGCFLAWGLSQNHTPFEGYCSLRIIATLFDNIWLNSQHVRSFLKFFLSEISHPVQFLQGILSKKTLGETFKDVLE